MSVRFAPSPTGPFHIGNFRTAWISREWARVLERPWIVRFENIDEPRNIPGAMQRQLDEMRALKLVPDRILVQSERRDRHWQVFFEFFEAGLLYPCVCSRKAVREAVESAASAPHGPTPAYSGRCRKLKELPETDLPTLAWRIRCRNETGCDDFVVARTETSLDSEGLPRKETFVPAYHWACAIDDYDGDHALLVRAWDLEEAAGQQRFIHEHLGLLEKKTKAPPAIFHCSLVTAVDGGRLEKRARGVTLPELLRFGETSEGLTEKFRQSFRGDWKAFEPGRLFGEARKSLNIEELLNTGGSPSC
jgi:glutamyl-tRNA synthetase